MPHTSTGHAAGAEAMEEAHFVTVEKLQDAGVNASDCKKLHDANIRTTTQLLMTPRRAIMSIKGISDAKADKMLDAAKKVTPQNLGWKLASTRQVELQQRVKITTGASAVDEILGGGYETGTLIEISGESRTGKSQLAHMLCVTSQLGPDMGGGSGKVVYIDTEGSFRPARIAHIAESRFGLDGAEVLDNVLYFRAYTHDQQIQAINEIPGLIVDDEQPFRAVIVDSLTALFRSDFSGRGELSERQQVLNKMLSNLKKVAEGLNVTVMMINQVTADPGACSIFAGASLPKPIGGNILSHAATTRLQLRKARENNRICKIYDSPDMPEAEASFAICDKEGVTNSD